jgi:FkbM family methyltransferase
VHFLERIARGIRHAPGLAGCHRAWDLVRPLYDRLILNASKNGLSRTINGTDTLRVLPRYRSVPERYEPDVWPELMKRLREDDVFVDVGAYIGLYTVSVAKRLGPAGRVVAFEPDEESHEALAAHVRLNGVSGKVRLIQAACGSKKEPLFLARQESQSHVSGGQGAPGMQKIECVTLDDVFPDGRVDVLKIDVEGYEERVLEGAFGLLRDEKRKPRLLFIEIHPYAWKELGTTDASLLDLLRRFGYTVTDLSGNPVHEMTRYGEVIAVSDGANRR